MRTLGLVVLVGAMANCASGGDTSPVDDEFGDGGSGGSAAQVTTPGSAGQKGGIGIPEGGAAGARSQVADGSAGNPFGQSNGATSASDGAGGGDASGCDSTNACESASDIGMVDGDIPNAFSTDDPVNAVNAQGTTSQFLKVRVTEAYMGYTTVEGESQRIVAELTSPPGANFELFLYVDDTSASTTDTSPCGEAAVAQSMGGAGQVNTATTEWGEGITANYSDDSRSVIIEVRLVSGTCSSDQPWTLVVRGGHRDGLSHYE